MTFTIRPSVGVNFDKASAIAIAGPSGSGKTESAMRLARGYCGSDKFVIIDTEEKRALYKKARYQPWDWVDFQPPFTPEATREVLELVKGYKAVILDSGSAEYAGEGGISDIAEDELERLAKGDPARMEALVGPSWKNAKRRHKRVLMSYLVRYPTLLIICLRAEPKVKFVKVEKNGRMVNSIVDAGYQPICEKMFMYEMLVGCKMTADNAGVPEHVKQLEPDLEPVFLDGKQIDEQTGKRLAEWAAGGSKINGAKADVTGAVPRPDSDTASSPTYITADEEWAMSRLCEENNIPLDKLKRKIGVESLSKILASDHQRVVDYIDAQIKAKA